MTSYSIEPGIRKYVKGNGFFSFRKKSIKAATKIVAQKRVETTEEFTRI